MVLKNSTTITGDNELPAMTPLIRNRRRDRVKNFLQVRHISRSNLENCEYPYCHRESTICQEATREHRPFLRSCIEGMSDLSNSQRHARHRRGAT